MIELSSSVSSKEVTMVEEVIMLLLAALGTKVVITPEPLQLGGEDSF